MVRRLLENAPLKIASLAVALLLWFVIAGEKTSEIGLRVPVEFQNFPKDLELAGDPVNSVEVRVRATPGVIARLGPGDVSAQLDMSDVEDGERIVQLTPESIRVPFGVKVVKITPARATLHFERTLQKRVPVRPRVVGRPAEGREVADVVSVPAEVVITGPKSRVAAVDSAFTEPVSVEGVESTVTRTVNLGLDDPLLRFVDGPRVRVTARVREVHETRAFDGLAVATRGGSAALNPGKVRVVLEGPAFALKLVTPDSVRPYVQVGGLDAPQTVHVAVDLVPGQAGVTVSRTEPEEVAVRPARRKE